MFPPDAFRGFPHFAAIHGPEQAKLIIQNEKLVLQNVKDFVESNKIDCDFKYSSTFEVCLDRGYADELAKSLAAFRAAGGDTSHIKFHEAKEARSRTNVAGAVCAYEWPAASNHPCKLTQWVLSQVIRRGAKLWTHCPAVKVQKHQGQNQRWNVWTPRGVVAANTIVHCTNAYAAYLLPELSSIIIPRRAQGHSYVPPRSLSGLNTLKSTMSLRYGEKHYFSVNQLKDGTIILGGQATRKEEDRTPEWRHGRIGFDDTTHNPAIMNNSITEFSKLAPETTRPGEGFSHVWTGIVGETPDAVPLIGPLEGLEGQWICAGHNGHGESPDGRSWLEINKRIGMARIFQCVPGLVKLMAGNSWSATGLPECFRFSEERLGRLEKANAKI